MTRKKEKEKPETAKPGVTKLPVPAKSKKTPSEEEMLELMVKLKANGVAECTSTLLRDKMKLDKESGRDIVRRLMKKLEADGKVVIAVKEGVKRKQYVYKLKEEA